MTDYEYQILDELYFVVSYKELKSESGFQDEDLLAVLISLYEKNWIRVLKTPNDEITGSVNLSGEYVRYFYFASKEGLFAHNLK